MKTAMSGLSDQVRSYFDKALADSQTMTGEERLRREVDSYNSLEGDLNNDGSYDCKVCRNKGFIEKVEDGRAVMCECKCMATRRSIWRMKRSGLASTISHCRFDNFRTDEEWQKGMLATAKKYAAEGMNKGCWFFVGGCVGAGKSHICTAIVREALLKHWAVLYVSWPQESTKIKAEITEAETYNSMISGLKDIDLLYIDDFFKPYNDLPPTGADVRLAYEILNFRYINRKPTIISSERYLSELEEIDAATGTRIYEMAKGYTLLIRRDPARNQRKNEEVLI